MMGLAVWMAHVFGISVRLSSIAVVAILCLALANNRSADAQADVEIGSLDCSSDPEIVELRNAGDEAQDMTGWTLISDPVESESFDLTLLESLAPGSSVFIESGPDAQATFIWSTEELFRDGDGSDFARLLDDTGTLLSDEACEATQTTSTPSPGPTPVVQPATASPGPASGVPDGGGAPDLANDGVTSLMAMFAGATLTGVGALLLAGFWLGSSLAPGKRNIATVYEIPPPPPPSIRKRSSGRPQSSSQALSIALVMTICGAILVALLFPLTARNK
jgi:lamin tail-like protein